MAFGCLVKQSSLIQLKKLLTCRCGSCIYSLSEGRTAHRELVAEKSVEVGPGVGGLAAALRVVAQGLIDERDGIALLRAGAALQQRHLAHAHQPQRLVHVSLPCQQLPGTPP